MIFRYAFLAALTSALALGGVVWWQSGRIDRMRAENAALRASVAALELDRELAREAAKVAHARAEAAEARAEEYDELRERILSDGEDALLPDWMLDALGGLRPGDNPPR